MSIKTDAQVIRDETVAGANTATRVGSNLVAIADDLIAKQIEIDANTAKISFDTDSSTRLANTSGTNTGDQDISGISANASAISGLQSSKQDNLTLTTIGNSGAATLVGVTLNIPQYSSDGSLKYSETFGNGILTTIPITHSLNTEDFTYSIREISTGGFIDAEVVSVDVNNLNIIFSVAPTTNQYRIIIIA